jgi:hypothetical protein
VRFIQHLAFVSWPRLLAFLMSRDLCPYCPPSASHPLHPPHHHVLAQWSYHSGIYGPLTFGSNFLVKPTCHFRHDFAPLDLLYLTLSPKTYPCGLTHHIPSAEAIPILTNHLALAL